VANNRMFLVHRPSKIGVMTQLPKNLLVIKKLPDFLNLYYFIHKDLYLRRVDVSFDYLLIW